MFYFKVLRKPSLLTNYSLECWDSLVLPTADSVIPSLYSTMLPDLFVHLYYNGTAFKSTLTRIWAKCRPVRLHTGLLVMERRSRGAKLEVERFLFAPKDSRPLGVELPTPRSLCGCWDRPGQWVGVYSHAKFSEHFSFLRSTCCRIELLVAIFLGPRHAIHIHGTTIAVETWDMETGAFPFNRFRMVAMRASVSSDLSTITQSHRISSLAGTHQGGTGPRRASWTMDFSGSSGPLNYSPVFPQTCCFLSSVTL